MSCEGEEEEERACVVLGVFGWLLVWIDGDLTRPWQVTIVGSDASPSFGFAVSVASAPPDRLRSFSRQAVCAGAHARLDGVVASARGASVRARDGSSAHQVYMPVSVVL